MGLEKIVLSSMGNWKYWVWDEKCNEGIWRNGK
jgi:hypothetical protein